MQRWSAFAGISAVNLQLAFHPMKRPGKPRTRQQPADDYAAGIGRHVCPLEHPVARKPLQDLNEHAERKQQAGNPIMRMPFVDQTKPERQCQVGQKVPRLVAGQETRVRDRYIG